MYSSVVKSTVLLGARMFSRPSRLHSESLAARTDGNLMEPVQGCMYLYNLFSGVTTGVCVLLHWHAKEEHPPSFVGRTRRRRVLSFVMVVTYWTECIVHFCSK